jgi:hypothetical protein
VQKDSSRSSRPVSHIQRVHDEVAALAEELQYPRVEIPGRGETFDSPKLIVEGPNEWVAFLRGSLRGGDLEALLIARDQLLLLTMKQTRSSSPERPRPDPATPPMPQDRPAAAKARLEDRPGWLRGMRQAAQRIALAKAARQELSLRSALMDTDLAPDVPASDRQLQKWAARFRAVEASQLRA